MCENILSIGGRPESNKNKVFSLLWGKKNCATLQQQPMGWFAKLPQERGADITEQHQPHNLMRLRVMCYTQLHRIPLPEPGVMACCISVIHQVYQCVQ